MEESLFSSAPARYAEGVREKEDTIILVGGSKKEHGCFTSHQLRNLKHVKIHPKMDLVPPVIRVLPSSLETLDLGNIRIRNLESLAQALEALTLLKTLILNNLRLGQVCVLAKLTPSLEKMTELKSLDLQSNGIGEEACVFLLRILANKKALESLNLSNNKLNSICMEILAPSLQGLSNLKSWTFFSNRFTDRVMTLEPLQGALEKLLISWHEVKHFSPVLPKLTHIQHLHIGSTAGGEKESDLETGKLLASAFENMPFLTSLNLYLPCSVEEFHILLRGVGALHSLRELNLHIDDMRKADKELFASSLKRLNNLVKLNLSENLLDCATFLSLSLEAMPFLQYLNLSGNEFHLDDYLSLGLALRKLPELTHLEVVDSSFDVKGTRSLIAAIGNLTRLVSLNLNSNNVDVGGARTLGRALKKLTLLEKLDLGYNPLHEEGIFEITSAFSNLTSLCELNLSNTGLSMGNGLLNLAVGMEKLVLLTHLDLSLNGLDWLAARMFAPTFGKLQRLKKLELSRNSIGFAGLEYIASGLGQLSGLIDLNLSLNGIGPKGGRVLSEILCNLHCLEVLNVDENDLGVEGMNELAPGLAQCSSLRILSLSRNQLDLEGAKILAAVLPKLESLVRLDLDDNAFGFEGVKTILLGLQNVPIMHLRLNDVEEDEIEAITPHLDKLGFLQSISIHDLGEGTASRRFAFLTPQLTDDSVSLGVRIGAWNWFRLVTLLCSLRAHQPSSSSMGMLPVELIRRVTECLCLVQQKTHHSLLFNAETSHSLE